MPLLCTPVWQTAPDAACIRSYFDWFVNGWTPSVILSYGRVTVLKETVFGGYETTISFKEQWWDWNSSAWRFEDIFEDYYVRDPGGTILPNAGSIVFRLGWASPYVRRAIVVDAPGSPYTEYRAFSLPPAPPDYWIQNGVPAPNTPFSYTA